jgi:hypothetical protein
MNQNFSLLTIIIHFYGSTMLNGKRKGLICPKK